MAYIIKYKKLFESEWQILKMKIQCTNGRWSEEKKKKPNKSKEEILKSQKYSKLILCKSTICQ